MDKKKGKKRDWKAYEAKLEERNRKIVDFLFELPTPEALLKELERMNKGKKGKKFEIPKSIILFSIFFKQIFSMVDRVVALLVSKTLNRILSGNRNFDHSAIVKRRAGVELDVPFGITPERLNGKRLYFDGMCLRVGRGGYYRSKRYKTDVKYLRIGLFTDDEGKAVDFVIGDEYDAEINMIREKMPEIKKSKAKSMTIDGAGSAKDVVVDLTKSSIAPIIRASDAVVGSMHNKPPPEACRKEKKAEELIWEKYGKEQEDYEKWRKETGYGSRWVFSEGKISSFKRMFGEEAVSRTQKGLHDEVCVKFMILDGLLPSLWG